MNRPRNRAVALLVVLSFIASACGSSEGRLEFGIRRLALDVAFVDEDASPPPAPEVVVRLVPAPAEVLEPGYDFRQPLEPDDFGNVELCPAAPPDQTVRLVASPSIIDPPRPGTYVRRNSGFIEIQGATLPLRIPYPIFSAWGISKAAPQSRPGPLGTPSVATPATQFTVKKSIGPTYTVTETYEIAPEALLLVERVTNADGVITRFRTDPPVEFFHFGAEGDDWTSAGADTENGFGVLIQGTIADREVIDVCGTLVDTFKIRYIEQVVNLATGDSSGTNETQESIVYFAPQFGGLVVREDMHTIQRTAAPDGSPLVIRLDYVSTLMTVEPGGGF